MSIMIRMVKVLSTAAAVMAIAAAAYLGTVLAPILPYDLVCGTVMTVMLYNLLEEYVRPYRRE